MRAFWPAVTFFVAAICASTISMGVVTLLHDKQTNDPLPDLGHKALPPLWVGKYTLLTFLVFVWLATAVLIIASNEHAESIYIRMMFVIGLLLLMRSFSILVTIQPSPYPPPTPPTHKHWYDVFDYRQVLIC